MSNIIKARACLLHSAGCTSSGTCCIQLLVWHTVNQQQAHKQTTVTLAAHGRGALRNIYHCLYEFRQHNGLLVIFKINCCKEAFSVERRGTWLTMRWLCEREKQLKNVTKVLHAHNYKTFFGTFFYSNKQHVAFSMLWTSMLQRIIKK